MIANSKQTMICKALVATITKNNGANRSSIYVSDLEWIIRQDNKWISHMINEGVRSMTANVRRRNRTTYAWSASCNNKSSVARHLTASFCDGVNINEPAQMNRHLFSTKLTYRVFTQWCLRRLAHGYIGPHSSPIWILWGHYSGTGKCWSAPATTALLNCGIVHCCSALCESILDLSIV